MSTADRYVTAAYLVFLAAVLAYIVIIAFKLARLDRELGELAELARAKGEAAQPPVRASGRVEGARGNREVPPGTQATHRG